MSLHKRHNVAAARRVASDARAMLGANGIIDTNKVAPVSTALLVSVVCYTRQRHYVEPAHSFLRGIFQDQGLHAYHDSVCHDKCRVTALVVKVSCSWSQPKLRKHVMYGNVEQGGRHVQQARQKPASCVAGGNDMGRQAGKITWMALCR